MWDKNILKNSGMEALSSALFLKMTKKAVLFETLFEQIAIGPITAIGLGVKKAKQTRILLKE